MAAIFLKLFFLLLPWQTRWIFVSGVRDGLPWEWWTVAVTIVELLLWIAALWSLRGATKGSDAAISRLLRQPIFIVLLATTVAVVVVIIVIRARPIALLHLFNGLLLFLILWTHPKPRRFIPWFLAGMIPAALLGFWQFAMQSVAPSTILGMAEHLPWQLGTSVVETMGGRWLRAYGPFPHPNIFGGYLAVATLLALTSRARWTQLLAPLFAIVLVLTFSRSAWLAAAAGVVLVIARSVATKQSRDCFASLAMTALAVVITSFIVLPLITTRVTSRGRLESKSTTERAAAWQRSVADLKNHPFLGVGLGHGADRDEPVHNVPALVAAETGLLGLAVFASLIGAAIVAAWRRRALSAPLLATIAVLALFDHYLWSLLPGMWLISASLVWMITLDRGIRS